MYMPERENVSEWAFLFSEKILGGKHQSKKFRLQICNLVNINKKLWSLLIGKNMHGNHLVYENIWLDFSLRMNHGYDVWENISFLNEKTLFDQKLLADNTFLTQTLTSRSLIIHEHFNLVKAIQSLNFISIYYSCRSDGNNNIMKIHHGQ